MDATDLSPIMTLPYESDSLSPLPSDLHSGLAVVSAIACISLLSSTALFVHLTYKLVVWHQKTAKRGKKVQGQGRLPPSPGVDLTLGLAEQHFGTRPETRDENGGPPARRRDEQLKPEPNQFLVLVYNLLLADMHQAMAFFLNIVWVCRNDMDVHTWTCWAQGWFVSLGDLAASLFITIIAIHTYLVVVREYKPPQWAVNAACVGVWVFNYGMAIIGLASTNNGKAVGGFYVRASAWCWINSEYETLRLVTHYLYIFISLAMTSLLYTLIFLCLRRRQKREEQEAAKLAASRTSAAAAGTLRQPEQPQHQSNKSSFDVRSTTATTVEDTVNRNNNNNGGSSRNLETDLHHHPAFLIYPVIYVVCTLPLALGRIATMAGADVPLSYFCAAGALITSNGFLDVLLWGSTRRRLIFGDVDESDVGLDTFAFMRTPPDRRFGNIVWVEGAGKKDPQQGGGDGRRDGRRGSSSGFWERVLRGPSGWRELGRGAVGSGGGGAATRSISQESLRGGATRAEGGGMAIQMDLVTTVVVEVDDSRDQKPGSRSREPSAYSSRSDD